MALIISTDELAINRIGEVIQVRKPFWCHAVINLFLKRQLFSLSSPFPWAIDLQSLFKVKCQVLLSFINEFFINLVKQQTKLQLLFSKLITEIPELTRTCYTVYLKGKVNSFRKFFFWVKWIILQPISLISLEVV